MWAEENVIVNEVCVCVCLSVCLSVYPSVPALAASASVETSKQRYSRVSLRLFLDLYVWSFEKTFRSKVMVWKSQYANELELTVSRFRAVSGPTKHSSYVKGNWWVEGSDAPLPAGWLPALWRAACLRCLLRLTQCL